MSAAYEGKTVQEWLAELRSRDVVERCAAALALADFDPSAPPAKAVLLGAINDTDVPVQVAARVALGLVQVPAENRRRMIDGLVAGDDYTRHSILQSLAWLASPEAVSESKAQSPNEISAPAASAYKPSSPHEIDSSPAIVAADRIASPPTPKQTPDLAPVASKSEMPDISLIHVMPWWFLLGATAICVLLGWLLRGVEWSKWVMAMLATPAGIYLLWAWPRDRKDTLYVKRFRSRARLAWSVVIAGLSGLAVTLLFPTGTILIDNETGAHVRLLLDGNEWMTIQTGESKKKVLAPGTYRLTVQAMEGNRIFDEHQIQVSAYEQHVLNVLGAQIYFEGVVQYGINGGSIKPVNEKWFLLPKVDYLFRDPPERIESVNPVNKSFFTKGAPPNLKRR